MRRVTAVPTLSPRGAWVAVHRSLLRGFLLGVFALVAVLTLSLAGPALTGNSGPSSQGSTAILASSGTPSVGTMTCANGTCSVDPSHLLVKTAISCNNSRSVTCTAMYTSDPTALLPAYRWKSATTLYVNPGTFDVTSSLFSFMASLSFSIAAFLWFVLLGVVNWALNLHLVDEAASAINSGYLDLSKSIIGGGALVWIILLIAAFYLARLLLKGGRGRILSLVLVVLIPLSTMFALSNALAKAAPGSVPQGSPAWVAEKGANFVDIVGGELATGFGAWNAGAQASSGSSTSAPTCAAYTASLYDQFYLYDAAQNAGAGSSGSSSGFDSSAALAQAESSLQSAAKSGLTTVSYLWQQAFMTNWVDAQYGSWANGSNAYCHVLESNAGTSPNEQKAIMDGAGPYDGQNYSGINQGVFSSIDYNDNTKSYESQMLAWEACHLSGGVASADPGWKALTTISSKDCAAWYAQTAGTNAGVFGLFECSDPTGLDSLHVPCALEINTTGTLNSLKNRASAQNSSAAQQDAIAVAAMWGHNPGQRLLDGILSLITAIVYLYALGALAIGSVLAQLGLVLMLALLPVTLLLLAIPTKEGGRIAAGTKLLKMTLGFFVSKLTLTVIMLLLVQAIALFENLTASSSPGGFDMIFHAVIPLVCLFLVRKLLSAAGVGNITSLSGAVGMPVAAGLTATGDKQLRSKVMGSFNKAAEKTGLNKADRMAKKIGQSPARLAKNAGGRLANRAGLPLLRDQLLGKKDAKGNLVEGGLAQRMTTLSGWLAFAKNNRITGDMMKAALATERGKRIADAARFKDKLRGAASDDVIAQQMRERSALLKTTVGKAGVEKRNATAEFYLERATSMLDRAEGIRDGRGDLVKRYQDYSTIYGYDMLTGKRQDTDGSNATVVHKAQINARLENDARDKAAVTDARDRVVVAASGTDAGARGQERVVERQTRVVEQETRTVRSEIERYSREVIDRTTGLSTSIDGLQQAMTAAAASAYSGVMDAVRGTGANTEALSAAAMALAKDAARQVLADAPRVAPEGAASVARESKAPWAPGDETGAVTQVADVIREAVEAKQEGMPKYSWGTRDTQ